MTTNSLLIINSQVDPAIYGLLGSFVTVGVGGLIKLFSKKSDNLTSVEIAKINASKDEVGDLKKELEQAFVSIKEIESKLKEAHDTISERDSLISEKDKTIAEYESLLKHFKVLFNLIYKQLIKRLEGEEDSMIVLQEVKKIFDQH